jgi:uncharacterized membrane protein
MNKRTILSTQEIGAFAILTSLMIIWGGYITTSWIFSIPTTVLLLIIPGYLILSGYDFSAVEQIVLVPTLSLALLGLSSLLLPVIGTLGYVETPFTSNIVSVVASLPLMVGITIILRNDESLDVPSIPSYVLIGLVPMGLGALGGSLQTWYGIVFQNYIIMVLMGVFFLIFYFKFRSDLEGAIYLYGLSSGILLSHLLVTKNAVGVDIQYSLYAIEQILESGIWNLRAGSHNSLPLIVAAPAILTKTTNIPIDYIFKLVYAMLFALAPVAIYTLSRSYLDKQASFVAGSLFVVYFRFFHIVPGKQHMAELFLITFFIVWIKSYTSSNRNIICLIIASGLVFSHYGVTFILILLLFCGFIYSLVLLRENIGFTFIATFSVFSISWYLFAAGGGKVAVAVRALISSVQSLLATETQSRTGATVVSQSGSLIRELNLILFGLLLASMAIGILYILYRNLNREAAFSAKVDAIALGFWTMICASIVVSGFIGIDRMVDIGLILLAPVAVRGFKIIVDIASNNSNLASFRGYLSYIPIIFVVTLLLFTSGLAYEASGEPVTSAINLHQDPNSVVYSTADYHAVQWLNDSDPREATTYVDWYSQYIFIRATGRVPDYLIKYEDNLDRNPKYLLIRDTGISNRSKTSPEWISKSRAESYSIENSIIYDSKEVTIYAT